MSAREEILSKVKRAIGAPGHTQDASPAPLEGARLVTTLPDQIVAECDVHRAELIERFSAAVQRVGGRFSAADSAQGVGEIIDSIIAETGGASIIGWESPLLEQLGLAARFAARQIDYQPASAYEEKPKLVAKAAGAAVGITAVDYALADSGSLVLLTGAGRPRSVSLLPPTHIAILQPEQIIRGLDDLFGLLATRPPNSHDLSSAVTIITGPSRTADIELTLVVGVHGPQRLHVILYRS
jgi:L-lactate dehydrogenase complex protein LldG